LIDLETENFDELKVKENNKTKKN